MARFIIVLRVLGCALIGAATIELLARLDDRITHGAPLFAPYNELIIYRSDEVGRIGKPYGQYLKWRLNSIGFRGPELHKGRIRIACIGSSETFGVYESEGHEFPRQLERELNTSSGYDEYDVVNVAYPGMTVRTAARRVPYMVRSVNPQYALIYPNFANYIWRPWLENAVVEPPAKGFELRISSRLANVIARILPERIKQWRRELTIQRAAAAYPVMSTIPEDNVSLFVHDLDALLSELRASGVTPILMTHATRFQKPVIEAERHYLTQWRIYFPMLNEDGFLDMEERMNASVRDLAAATGTRVIDIDAQMPRGPRYFGDFVHFTDLGAAQMSRIIAGELRPVLANERVLAGSAVNRTR